MEGIRNLDEEWKEERDRARREGGRRRGRGNRSAACGGYHVGDAIAMPFANINFSELIKIVYTLFTIHEYKQRRRRRHRQRRRHRLARNACGFTLPPTRYMLAVMLLASCVDPRAKLAFSWLPWISWYSVGIGIETTRPPKR